MGLEEARSSFKSQDDGLALEGGSVGLYVPLCKFNQSVSRFVRKVPRLSDSS
jgi:hypothetical protein